MDEADDETEELLIEDEALLISVTDVEDDCVCASFEESELEDDTGSADDAASLDAGGLRGSLAELAGGSFDGADDSEDFVGTVPSCANTMAGHADMSVTEAVRAKRTTRG